MEFRYKVAVMDDEPLIRRGIKNSLISEGISARVATSVNQLIKIVQTDHFDASVVDIRMSPVGTEGLDAIEVLRRIRPGMYIEVLTAFKEFEDNAYERGADLVIIKGERKSVNERAERIRYGILNKKMMELSRILEIEPPKAERIITGGNFDKEGWTAVRAEVLSNFANQLFSNLNQHSQKFGLNNKKVKKLKNDVGSVIVDAILNNTNMENRENSKPKESAKTRNELQGDENYISYMKQKNYLIKKNLGKEIFVAYVDGVLAGVFRSERQLYSFLDKKFPNKDVFIKKINNVEKEINLNKPRKVLA